MPCTPSETRKLLSKVSQSGGALDDDLCTFLCALCEHGARDDIDDLLFSLCPDLASTVDERKLKDIIDTLAGDSESALPHDSTVFPSVERGLVDENESEHESMADLRAILEKYDFPETDPVDSDTLFYLLNIWEGTEPEERLALVKSYIDIDLVKGEDKAEALLRALLAFLEEHAVPEEPIEELTKVKSQSDKTREMVAAVEKISSNTREKPKELSESETKQRKQLVKKHGFGVDPPKFDEKGKPAKAKPVVLFVENEKLKSKQRYRDGKVVANKGEKYIVEKEEEYDSGQRGRVKTKGKRGPGAGKGL